MVLVTVSSTSCSAFCWSLVSTLANEADNSTARLALVLALSSKTFSCSLKPESNTALMTAV